MQRQSKTIDWAQVCILVAAWAIGLLIGVVVANRGIILLKPELSMDGIATVLVGLVLVIALHVAVAYNRDRRNSAAALLSADVAEVVRAAKATHDYVVQIRGTGGQVELSDESRQRLQGLIQEYSNSLVIVEHTLELCGFDVKDELDVCKRNREGYKDLLTGDPYPTITGTVFRAESGEHTTIQKNLRTLLFKIGRR